MPAKPASFTPPPVSISASLFFGRALRPPHAGAERQSFLIIAGTAIFRRHAIASVGPIAAQAKKNMAVLAGTGLGGFILNSVSLSCFPDWSLRIAMSEARFGWLVRAGDARH